MCPDPVILSAFFDNEVSESEKRSIENHLSDCPACRATLELFTDRKDALCAESPRPVRDTGEQLQQFWAYVGQQRVQKVSSPRRLRVPVPVAAAAALALALATVLNFVDFRGDKMPNVVLVEAPAPAPTVVSLTVTPGQLDEFFSLLEDSRSVGNDGLVILPSEFPVSMMGEPEMVRPASLEGGN